jgi:hypothetical protein
MLSQTRLTSGSGGSTSGTDFTTTSEETSVVTTQDDPVNDPVFGGGKTGSETMAEGGSPSAVVTSDPNASSLEEKMKEDGAKATVQTFTDLAQDGNDSDSGPTFDHVENNEEGKNALQDTAQAFVDTAKKATQDQNSQNDQTTTGIPQAETAAQNAANAATGGNGGGVLSAILGFFSAVVGAITALGGN